MIKANVIKIFYLYNFKDTSKSRHVNFIGIKLLLYIALFFFFFNASKVSYTIKKNTSNIINITRAPYRFKTSRHQLTSSRFFLTLVFQFKLIKQKFFFFFKLLMLFIKLGGALLYINKVTFQFFLHLEWASYFLTPKN